MNYTRPEEQLRHTIERATAALAHFAYKGLQQNLESLRLARVSQVLMTSGCSARGSYYWDSLAEHIAKTQHADGGWADVEETLWSLGYLSFFGDRYCRELARGNAWVISARLPCGAWGKSSRDQPRIPITCLVSILLPSLVGRETLFWVSEQWGVDLASPTPLTYKGAFYLLSTSHCQAYSNEKLVEDTIEFIEREQNEDGGFGPWREHPIGSCPWITGVVLWGLSKAPLKVSNDTLIRATSWLESTQLSNGLWPYHYLDDATAMALIGLSSVLPLVIKQD